MINLNILDGDLGTAQLRDGECESVGSQGCGGKLEGCLGEERVEG